jgi:hypothetical protein
MPFAGAEVALGALAEYDIPVMPHRLQRRWWATHSHIIVRGNETRQACYGSFFANPSVSPGSGV